MERVRFLRAGLVTPLPGGPGIGSAGIMTGLRGASLDWDSGRRLTPAGRKSQETRPGLSHGIDLRGKRRGGAPLGVRTPMGALPRPKHLQVATSVGVARLRRQCALRRSASPSVRRQMIRDACTMTRAQIASRERWRLSAPR